MVICQDVSKSVAEDENLQSAYNSFRNRKGLDMIDFKKLELPHEVRFCMDCLLDCFEPQRVDLGNYELDEVSAYRGTLMHGIGIKPEGRYPRRLGDELGIQRKRAF